MGLPKTAEGVPIVQLLSAEQPINPAMTSVARSYYGELTNKQTVDDVYTITGGKSLRIQRLVFTADDLAFVELHSRANGGVALSGSTLVAKLWVNESAAEVDVGEAFASGQIVLRVTNTVGGKTNAFARWKGFES